jgi:hypothetical protein
VKRRLEKLEDEAQLERERHNTRVPKQEKYYEVDENGAIHEVTP